jgi:hypothetical protein
MRLELGNRTGENAGAGDIPLKMWLAAEELVGCGPIPARLQAATWGLAHLREDDFPEDVRQRAAATRKARSSIIDGD